jgi:hypothetical protein
MIGLATRHTIKTKFRRFIAHRELLLIRRIKER